MGSARERAAYGPFFRENCGESYKMFSSLWCNFWRDWSKLRFLFPKKTPLSCTWLYTLCSAHVHVTHSWWMTFGSQVRSTGAWNMAYSLVKCVRRCFVSIQDILTLFCDAYSNDKTPLQVVCLYSDASDLNRNNGPQSRRWHLWESKKLLVFSPRGQLVLWVYSRREYEM